MKKIITLKYLILVFIIADSNAIAPKYWRLNSVSAKAGIISSKVSNDFFDIPEEHYLKIFFYPSVSINFFKRECIQHKFIVSYQRTTIEMSSNLDSKLSTIEFINGAYAISLFPPNKKVYPYLDIGPFISVHLKDNTGFDWSSWEGFNKVSGGILTNLGVKYEHEDFEIFLEISRNGYIVSFFENDDFDDSYFEYWINSYSSSLGISLKF